MDGNPNHLPPSELEDPELRPSPDARSHDAVEDDSLPFSNLLTVESWRPDLVTRQQVPSTNLLRTSMFADTHPARLKPPRLVTPLVAHTLWDKPAAMVRGTPTIPPPGKESLSAEGATHVGHYIKAPRDRVWNLFEENHPACRRSCVAPSDRQIVPNPSSIPSSSHLPHSLLGDWDLMVRRGFMHVTGAHVFLDLLTQRISEIWPEGDGSPDHQDDPDYNAHNPTDFVQDSMVQGLMERLSHHLSAVADSLASTSFNYTLLLRDTLLQRSSLTREQQAALRSIPAQPNSLFGNYAAHFIAHRAEASREAAHYAAAAPRSTRPARPASHFRRPPNPAPPRAQPRSRPPPAFMPATTRSAPATAPPRPRRQAPTVRPQSSFRFGHRPFPKKK